MEFEILKVLFDDSRRKSKVVLQESPSDDNSLDSSSLYSNSSESLSRDSKRPHRNQAANHRNRKPPYGIDYDDHPYRGVSRRDQPRKRKRAHHSRRDPTHRPINYWKARKDERDNDSAESYGRVAGPDGVRTVGAPVKWRRFSTTPSKRHRTKQRRRSFDEARTIETPGMKRNGDSRDIFGASKISRVPFNKSDGVVITSFEEEINPFTGEKTSGSRSHYTSYRNADPIPHKRKSFSSRVGGSRVSDNYKSETEEKAEYVESSERKSPPVLVDPEYDSKDQFPDTPSLSEEIVGSESINTEYLTQMSRNLEIQKEPSTTPPPKPRPSPAQQRNGMKPIPSINLSPKSMKDHSSSFSSIRKTLGRLNQDTSDSTVGDASWGSIRKSLAKLQQRYIDNNDSSAGRLHIPDSSSKDPDASFQFSLAHTDSIPTIPHGPTGLPVVYENEKSYKDDQARSSQEMVRRPEPDAATVNLRMKRRDKGQTTESSEVRNILKKIDENYIDNNLELVPYIHKHRSETATEVSRTSEIPARPQHFKPEPVNCSRMYFFINFYTVTELICILCLIIYILNRDLLPLLIIGIFLQLYLISRIVMFFPESISLRQSSVYFHSSFNVLHWAIPRKNIISIQKTLASPLDFSCRPLPTLWFQVWLNVCSCSARASVYLQTRRPCAKLDKLLEDSYHHRNNYEGILNHLSACDRCLHQETEI